MLCAAELRHLGDEHRAALGDEAVSRVPEGRVSRQAAEAVRAAALHAERELARRALLARELVHLRQHPLHDLEASVDGGLRAAGLLDADPLDGLVELHAALLQAAGEDREVGLLTAEVEEDDAGDVRVLGVVLQGPHQDLEVRAVRRAAALVVGDGDDAVDVRVLLAGVEGVLRDRGDGRGLVRGAHARGNDEDEVPRADAAVRATEALEGAAGLGALRGRGGEVIGQLPDHWNLV